MTVGVIGTDYGLASLAMLERLAVAGDRLDTLLDVLRAEPQLAEVAVLSTCNRVEIYVAAEDVSAALACSADRLVEVAGIPSQELAGVLESHVDIEAAGHLFAVAAGLRSLAVGETQILAQVREAFAYATTREAAGPELQAMARAAVRCGKRVRAETTFGTADTSVSALAVEVAQQRLEGLQGRSALLIGAGRINEVSARLLRAAGIGSMVIVSRTPEAAARLAAMCGGHAATMEDLPALLAGADLAITATQATQPLVVPDVILPRAPERPLLICDLAVPRDVDSSVGAVAGVELVDMDGLRPDRGDGAGDGMAAAWTIVDACVERYAIDVRTRRAVPLIAKLRAHVDRQKDTELARTLAGLEHLAPADRDAVALLAHRLINRMFHHLATRLKAAATEVDAEMYLSALAFLFDGVDTEYSTITAPESAAEYDDTWRADVATTKSARND